MNKQARLIRIILLLQGYGTITAEELAKKLEVNSRTIYRDIDELCYWGIPIISSAGPSGGYSLPEGYSIDPDMFTFEQVVALGIGGNAISIFSDLIENRSEIDVANAKLLASMQPHQQEILRRQIQYIIFDNSSWFRNYVHLDTLRLLKTAVIENKSAEIEYFERDSFNQEENETAFVDPYGLVFKSDTWYLVGHSHKQKEIRRWNLTRIIKTNVLAETFERPNKFILSEWWREELENFGQGEIRVLLSINKSAWYRFSRTSWKMSNRFYDFNDHIVVEMYVDKYDWLIDLVLNNRGEARILYPLNLREEIQKVAQKIDLIHSSKIGIEDLNKEILGKEEIDGDFLGFIGFDRE